MFDFTLFYVRFHSCLRQDSDTQTVVLSPGSTSESTIKTGDNIINSNISLALVMSGMLLDTSQSIGYKLAGNQVVTVLLFSVLIFIS